jgi:hypothetical protein
MGIKNRKHILSLSTVMISALVLATALGLTGCGPGLEVAADDGEAQSSVPEGPMVTTPEQTVEGFYNWYLGYARDVGNPLVDKAYQSSEYLTDGFIEQVDQILASFDRGGYDPFLCAQDVPESVVVDEAVISGDGASLTVNTSFEGHAFTVELQQANSRWTISNVVCVVGK